jgi:hypothetical protein
MCSASMCADLAGDASIDRVDRRQVVSAEGGGCRFWWPYEPTTAEPLCGLRDIGVALPTPDLARARFQVVGFVHEEGFADDEIRQVTRLYTMRQDAS